VLAARNVPVGQAGSTRTQYTNDASAGSGSTMMVAGLPSKRPIVDG
jgi:hypothetical protein